MLTSSQIDHYESNGYVVVPKIVSPQRIEQLRNAHNTLLDCWSAECSSSREDYERVVSQWTNLHTQHPSFHVQIHHPTIVSAAQQLLKTTTVQLFHDHFISKPPETSAEIPWHQDYPFWPIHEPRVLSCWLALDDADEESGSMYFIPGAQHSGEKPPVDFLDDTKDWGDFEHRRKATTLRAGDCVFHHCLSWHSSPPNCSRHMRRAFIAIMMDSQCRWDPNHSAWHPMNDFVTVASGEPFNTDHFPILNPVKEDNSCCVK